MKKFVSVLLVAMIVMLTSCQGSKEQLIGINQFAPHPSLDNCRYGFIEGLRQEGFINGENVKIEVHNAQADPAVANSISESFTAQKAVLICGIATPSAQSSYNSASEKNIPVVFSAVSDPIAASLVKSMDKPENNVTGTSDTLPIEAQLKMIRAFLPEAEKIGILYTTSEINSISQIEKFKSLAPDYGFTIIEKGISTGADIPMAADAILNQVDCLTNLTDNTVVTSLPIIIEKANAKKIPVFGSEEEQLKSGCIASESLDYFELGIETGKIAAKILKGEKAGDIPVSIIEASKPVINKTALNNLGIAIPSDYADAEVVE